MITNNGKVQHLNVIAGKATAFADRFVLGASSSVLPEAATDLDFSWGSFPVTDTVVDKDLGQVVFYGTIPAELAGEIKELGLATSDARVVRTTSPVNRSFLFDSTEGWTALEEEDIDYISESSKMGPESLLWTNIQTDQQIFLKGVNISMTGVDLIKTKINCDAATVIELSFYSSDTQKLSKQITLSPGENYIKESIKQFSSTGEFNTQTVVMIGWRIISGSGIIDIDCLVLSDTENGGLVMRQVPADPIRKLAGSSMEIEMAVMLSV